MGGHYTIFLYSLGKLESFHNKNYKNKKPIKSKW